MVVAAKKFLFWGPMAKMLARQKMCLRPSAKDCVVSRGFCYIFLYCKHIQISQTFLFKNVYTTNLNSSPQVARAVFCGFIFNKVFFFITGICFYCIHYFFQKCQVFSQCFVNLIILYIFIAYLSERHFVHNKHKLS